MATQPAPPRSVGDVRALQATWKQLSRRRRQALEVRNVPPSDAAEAEAVLARGVYLRSWAGALEWVLAGTIAVVLVHLLQYAFTGAFGPSWVSPVAFLVPFSLAGVVVRRWRGNRLLTAGQAVLEDGRRRPGS